MRTARIGGCLALLLAACGCGGSGLVEATGTLTYQGKPVPSTLVTFMPDDGSRRSTGVTDDEGKFTLRFSRTLSGVKPGSHKVFLRYDLSVDEELGRIKPKASPELKAVIARYGDVNTSPLHYEITQNGQHIDIHLK